MDKDLKRSDILSLDMATKTGFASTHSSGTWNFTETKKRNDNKKHLHFYNTVKQFIIDNEIKFVVAEAPVLNKRRYTAMVSLSELRGILFLICDELGLPEPKFESPSTIKLFATKNGHASKEQMVMAVKRNWNIDVVDDNEADAICLMYFFFSKHKIRK